MNGFEHNPYASSNVVATETRYLSGFARRASLRALDSLVLATLFCLSFLFLGSTVNSGVYRGWDYTIFFVTEYPSLTATIVLWNGFLRGIFLPRLRLRTFWLPMVAGVASFLSFNWVHFRVDSIKQVMFPSGWGDETLELAIMGSVPSIVGILVESIWHVMSIFNNRRKTNKAA